MIILPKVLPAVFSYEGMKEKWGEDNPDEPYSRRADLETGRYALDKWLIRVDDEGKTISAIGWKEHSNHTVVGGLLATKRGEELQGNSGDLIGTRQPQLPPSKPLVSAFEHKRGDNERWMAGGRSKGWAFPNDAKFQEYSQLIPQEVLNDWLGRYPDTMGIKPNNAEDLNKGYYLDDVMGDWFNVLKYLPDNSFEEHSIGEPIPNYGTQRRFKDTNIKSMGSVKHKAFVTEQYLRQVNDRIPTATSTMIDNWLIKLNALNLSKGKYWFFGSSAKPDRTHVMIDVINKGDRFLDTSKKLNLEGIDKAIVFIGVSKEMVGKIKNNQYLPKTRKFIDLWGKGGVRGLRRSPAKKRRFPKEPKDIFPKSIKKWQEVLKWRPDDSYRDIKQYLTYMDNAKRVPAKPTTKAKEGDMLTVATGHYIQRGEERVKVSYRPEEFQEWADEIISRIDETKPQGNWFWRRPKEENIPIMFDVVGAGSIFPQQADARVRKPVEAVVRSIVFTTVMAENKMPNEDGFFDMWEEGSKDRKGARLSQNKRSEPIDINQLSNDKAKIDATNKTIKEIERDIRRNDGRITKENKNLAALKQENVKHNNEIRYLDQRIRSAAKSQTGKDRKRKADLLGYIENNKKNIKLTETNIEELETLKIKLPEQLEQAKNKSEEEE